MTKFRIAILSLLGSTIIGSAIGVIIKATLIDTPPVLVWFLRMTVAAVCFLPLFVRERPWTSKYFIRLCFISTGAALNTGLFIFGLQYTSASVTPLIYSLIPICILLYEAVVVKKKPGFNKIIGTCISFAGIILIFYRSIVENGTTIIGSWFGNVCILFAMIGWCYYLIGSKYLSEMFSAMSIASTSVIVTWFLTIPFIILHVRYILNVLTFSPSEIVGILYISIFGTFLMYILNQFSLSKLSTFIVGFSSYLLPICTIVFAWIFLKETLTLYFVVGTMLVLSGLFFSTTYELYSKRKRA